MSTNRLTGCVIIILGIMFMTGLACASQPAPTPQTTAQGPQAAQPATSSTPQANNYEKNRKEFELLLPALDKAFADWVAANKFTQEDGIISDDELRVLKEPENEQYVLQLFEYYISEAEEIKPDLAFELKRLPEIKEKVEAKTLDVKDIEPLEDIIVAAQNPKYKKGFEGMLNEGIREKIKLNTSIEVLYEGQFSEEIDADFAPLLNYSVYNLYTVWFTNRFSKTVSAERQDYYKKMTDFGFFTDRMISPNWVAWAYLFAFGYGGGLNMSIQANLTPQEYFKSKKGQCVDYTAFAIYCLKPKGYDDARGLVVGLSRPYTKYYNATAHTVPIFTNPKDNQLYVIDTPNNDIMYKYGDNWFSGPNFWSCLDDYYQSKTGVYGPYSSGEEAANDTDRRVLGDPNSKATSYRTVNFDMDTGHFK